MTLKVGINGMGRIGRMVIRAIIESQNKNIEIKHINNRSNAEASCTLIKYDSVHGKFNAELEFDEKHLIINKNKITFSQHSNISGIYNLGTGRPNSFNSVAGAIIDWHGKGKINYIDFPDNLSDAYQSYTSADLEQFRKTGCDIDFLDIKEGINQYLTEVSG